MQTVSYTADAQNGFRVHASNLPSSRNSLTPVQDTPEVALAKKRHLEQLRKAESWRQDKPAAPRPQRYQPRRSFDVQEPAPRLSNAIVVEPVKDVHDLLLPPAPTRFGSAGYSHQQHVVLPTTLFAMPLPLLHTSMRHTQDSLGQYEYSYTGDTSAKTESRALDGTTRGAYSYIDANGLLQQVHYIADRDGFRVLATNLPGA